MMHGMRSIRLVLGSVALTVALGSCTSGPESSSRGTVMTSPDIAAVQDALAQAEASWYSQHVSDYTWAVDASCFCGIAGPWRVTVENGVPTHIENGGHTMTIRDAMSMHFPLKVEDLFISLHRAVSDADSLEASYDERLGYPTRISIDYDAGAIDDEVGIEVAAFRLLAR